MMSVWSVKLFGYNIFCHTQTKKIYKKGIQGYIGENLWIHEREKKILFILIEKAFVFNELQAALTV